MKSTKGFTLVELLVVLAITAVLAAVAFYGFSYTRKYQRDVERLASLQQIRSALQSCYTKNHVFPADLATLVSSGCLKDETVLNDPRDGTDYLYDVFSDRAHTSIPSACDVAYSCNGYSVAARFELNNFASTSQMNGNGNTLGTIKHVTAKDPNGKDCDGATTSGRYCIVFREN